MAYSHQGQHHKLDVVMCYAGIVGAVLLALLAWCVWRTRCCKKWLVEEDEASKPAGPSHAAAVTSTSQSAPPQIIEQRTRAAPDILLSTLDEGEQVAR